MVGENGVITAIFAVFKAIGVWFTEIVPSLTALFWAESTGLTFLGGLAVCALGVGIVLLVFNIIKDFLRFR